MPLEVQPLESTSPPMIRLTGVTKRYRMGSVIIGALLDVNLEVQRGEFVSIMGPSGSGKSSLLQILEALDAPTEGQYELEGRTSRGCPTRNCHGFATTASASSFRRTTCSAK